jgi:TolB-like protein/class 3 adenylate cyclase
MADAKRILAAILAADVVGYSRLMGDDERNTVDTLNNCRDIFRKHVAYHDGRVVDTAGDSILATFPSVVEAVECGVAVQSALAEANARLPANRRMLFRIGVNLGDIIEQDDGTVYGDGVNVAARLESLAQPGGLCVSGKVRDELLGKLDHGFVDLGEHDVKNIANPVRAYQVRENGSDETDTPATKTESGKRAILIASAVVVALVAAGVGVWQMILPPESERTIVAESSDMPSIAVLPFTNMSEEVDQEHFADGMTDDLITDLSKVSGLFVIARNSSFFYKGQAVNVPQVAAELGVRYVLEGSVRRADDMVRINAQLIDAKEGGHVWAETFDRPYENIFALQDEVTAKIIEALSVNLTDAEQAQIERAPTGDREAYELYQRGQEIVNRFDIEHYGEALSLFEQAIDLDPTFADAYIGQARIMFVRGYIYKENVPGLSAKETRDAVEKSAMRALALNPDAARAHAILAARHAYERDYEAALSSIETALAIAPNDVSVGSDYARILNSVGRPRDALAAIDVVLKHNPKPAPLETLDIAGMLVTLRQPERALSLLEPIKSKLPSNLLTEFTFALTYARLGDTQATSAALKKILKFWPLANIENVKIGFTHWKRREDIDWYMESFRMVGIPRYPFGFVGSEESRLKANEIAEIWYGRRKVGFAFFGGLPASPVRSKGEPFTWITLEDDNNTYTNKYGHWQGTSRIEGDRLLTRYDELTLGREAQMHFFHNPKGTPEGQNDYIMANPWGIHYFTVEPEK